MTTLPALAPAPPVGAAGVALCPPSSDGTLGDGRFGVQMERSWVVARSRGNRCAAPTQDPAQSGNPGADGAWLAPLPWEVIAIHAAVLPTGEVLHYACPGGGDVEDEQHVEGG